MLLSQKQLRKLISEAIQSREPGSPLFTPPPVQSRKTRRIEEKFGSFDRSDKTYFDGGPDAEPTIMPHNFEGASEETFRIFVDKIKEAFVESHMDIIKAGFSPESHDAFSDDIVKMAAELGEEIMELIAAKSDSLSEKF